jgi:hypothetical protein
MRVTSTDCDRAPLKLSLEKLSKSDYHVAANVLQKPNQVTLGTKFGGQAQQIIHLRVFFGCLSDYPDTRLSAVGSDEMICLFTAFAVIDPIVAEITAETTIEENDL